MSAIRALDALEVLDSRGRPTLAVDALLADGARGSASVPSGASTGRHEAVELRDGDRSRYGGLGVLRAVRHVREIIGPAVLGVDGADQAALDARLVELDGTADRSRLGANALLGVSLAVCRAAARSAGQPLWRHLGDGEPLLPLPMVNMLSGGLHAARALDVQDVLAVPIGAASFAEAMERTVAVRDALGRLLAARGLSTLKADEGGFGPPLGDNRAALEFLCEAIAATGLAPGRDVAIALDVAASQLYDAATRRYQLACDGRTLDASGLVELLAAWCDAYPIVSVEDGLAEDDWDGWSELTRRLGHRVQLVGDDLFVTSRARVERGVQRGVANAVLVKMNQVGTVSEAVGVVAQAASAGYAAVVSARSGETEDAALADLAVATRAGQIKVGSVAQSERLAKYNRLLRIEHELGREAPYAGGHALAPAHRRA
jgi:enolase